MGMRKYMRSIAKARLAEMGVDHVNKRMVGSIRSASNRRRQRTRNNRRFWKDYLRSREPAWRRILFGDMAKQYWAEKHRKEAQERNKRAALKKRA